MRKSLIIVMALALVFSLSLGVMACDGCQQDVTVKAPFLLECYGADTPVTMEFGMYDYGLGYVEAMNKMSLKVGAPSGWTVGASVDSNPKGVAAALSVSGGDGWVDVGTGWMGIKNGGQGSTTFSIHYRVDLDDLNSATDIDEKVTVQYDFI